MAVYVFLTPQDGMKADRFALVTRRIDGDDQTVYHRSEMISSETKFTRNVIFVSWRLYGFAPWF